MKNKLLLWGAWIALIPVTLFAVGENARPRSTTTGLLIGEDANAYIGFNGATRVRQQAATTTAWQALENYGLIASGEDYSVRHATVAVSAAELIAMYTTPKLLIAAPGAGKSIVVVKAVFTVTRTATAFTGGGVAIVQYDSTANGAGQQALDSTIAAAYFTDAAGTAISIRNGAVISNVASTVTQNKGLYLSNQTGVFADGTGTLTVNIEYVVI